MGGRRAGGSAPSPLYYIKRETKGCRRCTVSKIAIMFLIRVLSSSVTSILWFVSKSVWNDLSCDLEINTLPVD